MNQGDAVFLDGREARRRPVHLMLQTDGIAILEGGVRIDFWRYANVRTADAPKGTIRITARTAPELARLELHDSALAKAVLQRCLGSPQHAHHGGGASVARIVFWSMAAALSLVLTVIFLVPLLADRLTPFIPIAMERRLGDAVDNQVRTYFGGSECRDEEGRRALATLTEKLTSVAALPMPVDVVAISSSVRNAVALPGGRVYIFAGLLGAARGPDELAGVIAHELGHVQSRDSLRKLLQTGGSSFLLGLLFGDVAGGGAVILAARVLIDTRYSREAKASADAFAADVMLALGRSPRPLGEFLSRLDPSDNESLGFVSTHPVSTERMKMLAERDPPESGPPLLDAEHWQALLAICDRT